MSERIGIIMNGVTGRMGLNQHLIRSILAIRAEGGVDLGDGRRLVPDPILVGRNETKLRDIASKHGVERWTTDLDAALANPDDGVFFDASLTQLRTAYLERAITAGKAIYCEKPIAETSAEAARVAELAERAGVRSGVVQDKLWLPGIARLRRLLDEGFFGRVLSVRGEFGYWVFSGLEPEQSPQRPSWNYRAQDGGGIILDMFCHWQYLIENLFGPIARLVTIASTDLPQRVDERGAVYTATADDAAYAIFELVSGVVCQFNSSWTTRVRRDDLLTIQVDGTEASAVATLRACRVQTRDDTPRPVWNPDVQQPIDFYRSWREVDADAPFDNAFKVQWEQFLRHAATGAAWPFSLRAGVRGVQLAEAGLASWRDRRWVEMP